MGGPETSDVLTQRQEGSEMRVPRFHGRLRMGVRINKSWQDCQDDWGEKFLNSSSGTKRAASPEWRKALERVLWKACFWGEHWNRLKNNKKETMASAVFESCLCYLWTVNISESVNVFGLRFPHLLNKRLVYMFMVHSNSDILWSFWVKRQ